MASGLTIVDDAPLAPLTTLELGGRARHLATAADEATAAAAVAWAGNRRLPLLVLGGGSNLVVGDAGFDGLVLRLVMRGLAFEESVAAGEVLVHASAGEPWEVLVDAAVERGLGGVECLAGIPGLVGATPIQNVGAYGQEVSDTLRAVRALDRATGHVVSLDAARCDFGYRDSLFKRRPDAFVVLGVTFALRPGGTPTLRYRELELALAAERAGRAPTLADARRTVLALRRRKSMVRDPSDPNHRSVGSFFMNPVLDGAEAERVFARAVAGGEAANASDVPRFAAPGGKIKLSAGWLVEHAGFPKGFRRGPVGLSSNHALALVHHGGGCTADLLALAHEIQAAVHVRFGVSLSPEPSIV